MTPVFHRDFEGSDDPAGRNQLERLGPLIPIQVAIPASATTQYESSQLKTSSPVNGFALFDTGASRTCVDESVLIGLGLIATGTVRIAIPSGRSRRSRYYAGLSFPDCPLPNRDPFEVTGVDLQGSNYIALIGRDLMRDMLLMYDGVGARITFAF